MSQSFKSGSRSGLRKALGSCKNAFVGIGVFSGLINILMLSGSLFMLEVYDRVLPSRSVPTLIGLSLLTAGLFIFQGLLEIIRARLLVRIGNHFDFRLSPKVFSLVVGMPLRSAAGADTLQPVRDLDTIRSFISSTGPTAFFDLPWLPFYLAICFAFHPLLGATALGGAIILVGLTVATELWSRGPLRAASNYASSRNRLADAGRRNAEVLAAMAISGPLLERWLKLSREYLAEQKRGNDVSGGLGLAGRVLRMMLQSAVLAVGAYLVIQGEATAGIIIASSILTGRALAPVDLAMANWKGFISARQSWRRLESALTLDADVPVPLTLSTPTQMLTVEAVEVTPPGALRPVVRDIGFTLKAGSALGIIGSSASGKSSLARVLVSVWRPTRGFVRLDGAVIDQWTPAALGKMIGYLPQGVELIEGTIADNIARFDPDAPSEAVIAAAKAAGVHDMIVGFPAGYETPIGDQGSSLSAGQQQRVALARALYGDPFLVVLDEPNSNLDSEGDEALTKALLGVRERGGVAVVVAHRPSALAAVDYVLVMQNGAQQAFGPKDEILAKVLRREPTGPGLKVVPQGGV